MNEWQSFFPNYQPNQVLTSEHLNNLRRYLDEQNRLTRLRMSGMGIACGLTTREDPDADGVVIQISEGYGISSEGYLIDICRDDTDTAVDPVTRTRYKSYAQFRVYNDPGNYWVAGPAGNEQPIPIYELLSTADAEALEQEGENLPGEMPLLEEFDSFQPVIDNCHEGLFDRFIIVIYLECADESLKSCTANDCDNTGQKTNLTVRALLVNPDDVVGQYTCDVKLNDVNLYSLLYRDNLEAIRVPRWVKGVGQFGLTVDALSTYDEIRDGYMAVIDGPGTGGFNSLRDGLADGIEAAYDRYGPFLGLLDGVDLITPINDDWDVFELTERLRNTPLDPGYVQYAYDFIKDLAKAYNEFIDLACDLHKECYHENYEFCKHLQLGRVSADNTKFTRDHRNYWLNSALSWNQDQRFAQCQVYFIRMMIMVREFLYMDFGTGNAPPVLPTRVTPSKEENMPLGEHAIPFYYYDFDNAETTLYKAWAPQNGLKGRANYALGFHSGLYAPAPPDFILNPLDYDIDEYNFLRIEGIVGKSFHEVATELEALKLQCSLPFDLVTVQLSDVLNYDFIDYNCNFGDLHADFMLNKTCMVQNLMRLLDGLEFLAQFANGNGPTDEDDGFDLASAYDGIQTSVATALAILEGMNTDTLMEFFLDDGYVIATGDSVFGTVRDAYLDIFNEIQRLKLFAGISRQFNVIEQQWDLCSLPDKINTMQIIDRVVTAVGSFLDGCAFPKMNTLYGLFCERWDAWQGGSTDIFRNYAKKHPGLEHRGGVEKGGTFIMVVDELTIDPADPVGNVLADFSLPYLCCDCDKIEYPADTMITPYARPYCTEVTVGDVFPILLEDLLLVTEGPADISNVVITEFDVNSGANIYYDPDFSGGPAIIYEAPHALGTGEFFSMDSFYYLPETNATGAKPFFEGVINILVHFEIPILPVCIDDYASTLNQTSVIIDVVRNDCYSGDSGQDIRDLDMTLISDFGPQGDPITAGSSMTSQEGNALVEVVYLGTGSGPRVRYNPDPNFQGIDTFHYGLLNTDGDLVGFARVDVSVIGCCCDLDPIDCSTEEDVPLDITLPIENFGNVGDWNVYIIDDNNNRVEPGNPVGFPAGTGPDFIVTLDRDDNLEYPWSFRFEPAPGYTGKACWSYELVYKDDLQVCPSEVCVHVTEAECEPVIMNLPENCYCESIGGPLSDGGNQFYLQPAGGTLSLDSAPTGPIVNPFEFDSTTGEWYFVTIDPGSGNPIPLGEYTIRYEVAPDRFTTWTTKVVGVPDAQFTATQIAQTSDDVTYRFDIQVLAGHVERFRWDFGDGTFEEQSSNATYIIHTFDLVTPPTGTPPWTVSLQVIGAGCDGNLHTETVQPVQASFDWRNDSILGPPNARQITLEFRNRSTIQSGFVYTLELEDPAGGGPVSVSVPGSSTSVFYQFQTFDSQNLGACFRVATLVITDAVGNFIASSTDTLNICDPIGNGTVSFTGGSGPVVSRPNSGGNTTTSGGGTTNQQTLNRGLIFGPSRDPDATTAFFEVDQRNGNVRQDFPDRSITIMEEYFSGDGVLDKNDDFIQDAGKLFTSMRGLIADETALKGLVGGTRDASSGNLHLDALDALAKGIDNTTPGKVQTAYLEIYSMVIHSLISTAAMRDADLKQDSRLLEAFTRIQGHLVTYNTQGVYATKDDENPLNHAIDGASIGTDRGNFETAVKALRAS